jgi:hypothetical protein
MLLCAAPYHRAITSPLLAQDMNIPPIMDLASASQVINRYLAACCDKCMTTTHLDACPHCHKSCPAWGLPNTSKDAIHRCLEDVLMLENSIDWRSSLVCQVVEEFGHTACLGQLIANGFGTMQGGPTNKPHNGQ